MSTYTYNDIEPTDKDRVRGLIGDIKAGGWRPGEWLLSDESINATLSNYSTPAPGNFWEAAAQCALKAGRVAMTAFNEVDQGHRLRIKYHKVDDLWKVFEGMATEFRNNTQPEPGEPTNPGAITGHMHSRHYDPEHVGRCHRESGQEPAFLVDEGF